MKADTTSEIQKPIKLIAVYARVSTARQEEEHTIETQLTAVREFAGKNGYTIVKEYIDDGWSGDILARPQLDQLRQDAKDKIWEAVLIYDPDRLARRYSYQELVMDELREAGIEMIFVTTPAPKNGEEKILHGVKGLFAEYERVKIAERFRLGKIRKVKEGHILTSEAPYGLKYVLKKDKEHGYYEINEDEAKNLKLIFSLVDEEGLTIRGIVRRLQELDIKPRKSKRGVWSTSTLSHLLRNKTYIGEAYYGKSYAVIPDKPIKTEKYRKMRKTSRRIRPEEEWTKIPVQAILDTDLFMRVQEKLRTNFELSKRNRKSEYLLAGKTWCICGNRRTGEGPQKGKYLYYRCNNKVNNFPLPPTCVEKGVNARVADKLIWDKVAQLMSSPELMQKQIARWLNSRTDRAGGALADTEGLRKDIVRLRGEEERYSKAYGAGLFSIEQLRGYSAPVKEKIASLESRIATAEAKREDLSEAVLAGPGEIKIFAREARKTLQDLNFEAKQAIVRNILNKVVATQRELVVSGYIPIETSNNVRLQTIHRHRRPPERRQIHPLQASDLAGDYHRELSLRDH